LNRTDFPGEFPEKLPGECNGNKNNPPQEGNPAKHCIKKNYQRQKGRNTHENQ
jgi:hypothetical protein